MSAAAIQARRVPGIGLDPAPDRLPGDFDIRADADGQRWLWLCCPGCRGVTPLALRPLLPKHVACAIEHRSWAASGGDDAPTIRPSIHHVGCWHGWFTAGQLTAA
jgi:hypothetical protein